jgi:microcystin degradation protein MlrC
VATASVSEIALSVVGDTMADVQQHLPDFAITRPNAADAVREAATRTAHPVVLADVADNVGGGSPGDGTTLLAELLRQKVAGSVMTIADAEAAAAANAAGVDKTIEITLGGKSDVLHGAPVTTTARVVRISDGIYRTAGSWMTGQQFSMGPTVVLELPGGITVLVTSTATPPFHVEQLTANGIDPKAATIIVAKGAVAWRAAYGDLMASAIEVKRQAVVRSMQRYCTEPTRPPLSRPAYELARQAKVQRRGVRLRVRKGRLQGRPFLMPLNGLCEFEIEAAHRWPRFQTSILGRAAGAKYALEQRHRMPRTQQQGRQVAGKVAKGKDFWPEANS